MNQPIKKNVLGTGVSVVDYRSAVDAIMAAAKASRPFSVGALAVHGIMNSVLDSRYRYRMNAFNMVVPDGQPVRWALNLLHKAGLKDRVYGPDLTLKTCAQAARDGVPVYFFGSKPEVLAQMTRRLTAKYPALKIAGQQASLFRHGDKAEMDGIVDQIRQSGAGIVFVGLGCPRQEIWVYENVARLSMPVIGVGAAFDFHAGLLKQAPPRMQKYGLEWLYRFIQEPRRLWRRYAYLNPMFLMLLAAQFFRVAPFSDSGSAPDHFENYV